MCGTDNPLAFRKVQGRERRADGGALIVLDAATFKEVKRVPVDKPVGKYNLYNNITRSEGDEPPTLVPQEGGDNHPPADSFSP